MGITDTQFERAESEYNKNYDPLADVCSHCGAEDCFEQKHDHFEDIYRIYCTSCGEKIDEY